MENFRFLSFEETQKVKTVDEHIQEIEGLLDEFDKQFENVLINVKNLSIKDLQKDIRTYQREWKDN